MLSRRDFMSSTAAAVVLPAMPASVVAAPQAVAPALAWYFAGSDETVYPYVAESLEDAIRQYAWDHGATYAEYDCDGRCGGETFEGLCPHCGADPDAPASFIEASRPKAWEDIPITRQPTGVDWLEAGCNTICEECDSDGEAADCYAYKGRALCQECYDMARDQSVERLTDA